MEIFGCSAETKTEGRRFFVIKADDAEQALSNIIDLTDCPKSDITVERFEDLLTSQYGGFAELATI